MLSECVYTYHPSIHRKVAVAYKLVNKHKTYPDGQCWLHLCGTGHSELVYYMLFARHHFYQWSSDYRTNWVNRRRALTERTVRLRGQPSCHHFPRSCPLPRDPHYLNDRPLSHSFLQTFRFSTTLHSENGRPTGAGRAWKLRPAARRYRELAG